MEANDMSLRVTSFSCYLNNPEESLVRRITRKSRKEDGEISIFDVSTMDEHVRTAPPPFDDGGYGGYAPPYQSAGGFPGEYDEVTVEHFPQSVHSPDPYGFGSDPHPAFGSSTVPVSNGNGNPYDLGEDSTGIFISDGPVLPLPNEMHDAGFALREWRNLIYRSKTT